MLEFLYNFIGEIFGIALSMQQDKLKLKINMIHVNIVIKEEICTGGEELGEKEEKMGEKIIKYTVKDSLFTNLFREKKYLIQLYRALHPEDKKATEGDLQDVTISNVLVNDLYNDIGFRIGSTLLILIESQSMWTGFQSV